MLTSEGRPAALTPRIASALRRRTAVARPYFAAKAEAIARSARAIAERLGRGGRIYAFGRGAYATDAQHVAVEFVHPVLIGKPALPASDISPHFEATLPAIVRASDVVFAFAPPDGDAAVDRAIRIARTIGAFVLAFPGREADFTLDVPSTDEHLHQEIVEIVGHLIYESVHVFLEHRGRDDDVGASAFLYPFLGCAEGERDDMLADVVTSIRHKAQDAEALRERVADEESRAIAEAAATIAREVAFGGRLLLFGNGGSATDANDFALDCLLPPDGLAPISALSLAAEPATITAIANDVGRESIFLRQLIAHARTHDVVFALSTSGGSSNVIAALEQARERGHSTIALLGYDGGEIHRRRLADCSIVVRSDYVPRVQEAQAAIYHTLRHAIDWLRDDP